MSIYSSWEPVGGDYDQPDGHVQTYRASHIYPTTDNPARIGLASIPRWCIPGRDFEEDEPGIAPWLRLSVADNLAHNAVFGNDVDVLLDETAVRQLRDQLTDWLEEPKLHPKETR